MMDKHEAAARLEYLRGEIDAERISYGELAELHSLAEFINPGDTQLLEWAGVTEFPDDDDARYVITLDREDGGAWCASLFPASGEDALPSRFGPDEEALGDTPRAALAALLAEWSE